MKRAWDTGFGFGLTELGANFIFDGGWSHWPNHIKAPVTPNLAMQLAIVSKCVILISGALMQMPLLILKRFEDNGVERFEQVKHDIEKLWNGIPNMFHTGPIMMLWIAQCVLLRGNCYFHIRRKINGRIHDLEPLSPESVFPVIKDEKLKYEVRDRMTGRVRETYDAMDILHFRGLYLPDGVCGESVIRTSARGAINSVVMEEEYSTDVFVHGHNTPMIEAPPGPAMDAPPSQRQKREANEAFGSTYAIGTRGRQKIMVLRPGQKVTWPTVSARDQQMIESQKWSGERICHAFNVNPSLVFSENSTVIGTGIGKLMAALRQLTLHPYLTAWQAEITAKALREPDLVSRFHSDAILFGDPDERARLHRMSLGAGGQPGWKSINQVRIAEGDPPIGDLDDDENPFNVPFLGTGQIAEEPMEPVPGPGGPNNPDGGGAAPPNPGAYPGF